jgi:hypothetical protein
MVDQVRLNDGEETRLTFQYDNVTKSQSRAGNTYYTFSCEEGKYSCNNHCVRALQQAWPGKGGNLNLKRLSATAYEITGVEMGDGSELVMKVWNTNTNTFDNSVFDLDGLGEAAPIDKPAPQSSQAPPEPAQGAIVETEGLDMEDISNLQFECFRETMRNWRRAAKDSEVEGIAGDVAGALERAAVGMFIDCRRMGIVGMPKFEEEPQDDSGVTGGPNTPEGLEPLPEEHNPGTEDDIDLPF